MQLVPYQAIEISFKLVSNLKLGLDECFFITNYIYHKYKLLVLMSSLSLGLYYTYIIRTICCVQGNFPHLESFKTLLNALVIPT